MKKTAIIVATAAMLVSAPALARPNSLNVGLSLVTGKGGVVGTLLGAGRSRNLGSIVNANVTTTRGGVLGLLLGSGRGGHGHGGHGCGC